MIYISTGSSNPSIKLDCGVIENNRERYRHEFHCQFLNQILLDCSQGIPGRSRQGMGSCAAEPHVADTHWIVPGSDSQGGTRTVCLAFTQGNFELQSPLLLQLFAIMTSTIMEALNSRRAVADFQLLCQFACKCYDEVKVNAFSKLWLRLHVMVK